MITRLNILLTLFVLIATSFTAVAAQPSEFSEWPEALSPQTIGLKAANAFIKSPHMLYPTNNTIHYAEVLTWYGAINFSNKTQNKVLLGQLAQRFETFWTTERNLVPPANHVDFSVFGVVPLHLYLQTGDVRFRYFGLGFADAQWDNPLENGAEKNLTNQTRYWIDDMYMITALQGSAYRATHNAQYLDRAAIEMVAYLEKLQEENGLFHHASNAPLFWSRGNGWMAAGMTELLAVMPRKHPHRAKIFKAYQKMMATLLSMQSQNGLWHQLIDHSEFWEETSGSAMFTFAMATGVKEGWLPEKIYAPAVRKAWLALANQVNESGELQNICVGTGATNDVQYYLNRPRVTGDFHGQAPLLWTATALLP